MIRYKISALDVFYEMDERVVASKKCWIRDLKRRELNELVENMTSLNANDGKVRVLEQ